METNRMSKQGKGRERLTKTQKVVILVVLLILVFAMLPMIEVWAGHMEYTKIVTTICPDDKNENSPIPSILKISKDGTYYMEVCWMPEEEAGFITGLVLENMAGDTLFAVAADKTDCRSADLELAEGEYKATLYFITSKEEAEAFMEDYALEYSDKSIEKYDFAKSGTYERQFIFGFQQAHRLSPAKLGLCVGLVAGMILVAIFALVTKRGNSAKSEYDERQQEIRGRASQYSFGTLIILDAVIALLHILEIEIPVSVEMEFFCSIIIALSVQITYCLFHDAYFSLNEKKTSLAISYVLIYLLNAAVSVKEIREKLLIVDGKLAYTSLNLVVVGFLTYVGIIIWIKSYMDKRRRSDEEFEA